MRNMFKTTSLFLIMIPLALSLVGVMLILSTGQLDSGGNTNLYLRQIVWIIIGLIIGFFILTIDYYYIIEYSLVFYIIGIGLLLLTLLIGKEIKGARSWLGVGGLGIQASEFMKITYILFYAKFLKNISSEESEFISFIKSLLILAPPLILIMLQPDFGTTIIFLSIFAMMTLLGFKNITILINGIMIGLLTSILVLCYTYYKFYYLPSGNPAINFLDILFLPSSLIAIAIILIVYTVIVTIIELIQPVPGIHKFSQFSTVIGLSFLTMAVASYVLKPYQWNRILVFINPEFDRLGSGYNIIQAKIAIGAGGLTGQGLFQGTQNLRGFLPEKHTDFIFAILSEELGFIGSFGVILGFTIYFISVIRTILVAKDNEGAYVVAGILAMFLTHTIINIGMNLGVAPVTGLPLPFISYGGSFYLTAIVSATLILNIYHRRFIH